jgi:hypothetical protein
MQNYPDDIVHLILAELRGVVRSQEGSNLDSKDMCIGPDEAPGEATEYLRAIVHVALSSCRLCALTQPLLYDTIHLQDTSRVEGLWCLLKVNSRLILPTKRLVLGRTSTIDNLYTAPAEAREILTHLHGTRTLRVSGLRITSDFISTCFVELGSLQCRKSVD